jgi:hypothetical protein
MTAPIRYYGWENQVRILPLFLRDDSHNRYLCNLCDELRGQAEVPIIAYQLRVHAPDGQARFSWEMIESYFEEAGFSVREVRHFQGVTVLLLASRR